MKPKLDVKKTNTSTAVLTLVLVLFAVFVVYTVVAGNSNLGAMASEGGFRRRVTMQASGNWVPSVPPPWNENTLGSCTGSANAGVVRKGSSLLTSNALLVGPFTGGVTLIDCLYGLSGSIEDRIMEAHDKVIETAVGLPLIPPEFQDGGTGETTGGCYIYIGNALKLVNCGSEECLAAGNDCVTVQEGGGSCTPRPSCLDTPPFCLLPEPIGGWCPTGTTGGTGGTTTTQYACCPPPGSGILAPCMLVSSCSQCPYGSLGCTASGTTSGTGGKFIEAPASGTP